MSGKHRFDSLEFSCLKTCIFLNVLSLEWKSKKRIQKKLWIPRKFELPMTESLEKFPRIWHYYEDLSQPDGDRNRMIPKGLWGLSKKLLKSKCWKRDLYWECRHGKEKLTKTFEQTDSSFADWTKEQKNKNKKIKEKERDMDLMWWSVWDFETGRQRCLEAIKIMSKGFG